MKPSEMRKLVRVCTLGAPHKMTLLVLATYADDSLTCFPGRPALCADTGLSDRRLREVLSELVEAGFVKVNNAGNQTVYTLCQIGEISPKSPSKIGEISPEIGENSPEIGEISPKLLYKGEDTIKRTMKVLSPSTTSAPGALEDPKLAELNDPITSWVNRTTEEALRSWPEMGPLVELRGTWMTWLRHVVALTGRRPSFVTVDLHLKTVRQAFTAGGEAHAIECLTWSMTHSKPLPVVKPSTSGNVVAFPSSQGGHGDTAKLRGQWVAWVRGCEPGLDPLERLREVNPALAAKIPDEWAAEANEAREG